MYQGDALRFTNCDISKSLGPATDYLPVGYLNNQEDELIYNCCGTCSFYADQVAILFFPPADSPCLNATGGKNESEPPDKPLGSIAVYDGVTLYVFHADPKSHILKMLQNITVCLYPSHWASNCR